MNMTHQAFVGVQRKTQKTLAERSATQYKLKKKSLKMIKTQIFNNSEFKQKEKLPEIEHGQTVETQIDEEEEKESKSSNYNDSPNSRKDRKSPEITVTKTNISPMRDKIIRNNNNSLKIEIHKDIPTTLGSMAIKRLINRS